MHKLIMLSLSAESVSLLLFVHHAAVRREYENG